MSYFYLDYFQESPLGYLVLAAVLLRALLYTVIIQKWSNESNIGIHAMQIAVATSAFVMLCSASFAVFRHCRSGHIDWQKSAFVGWYCIWWNCRCGNGLIV